jgi:hypothetical protein
MSIAGVFFIAVRVQSEELQKLSRAIMEIDMTHTRASEDAVRVASQVRTDMSDGNEDLSDDEATYWGVLCRFCV